MANQEQLEILKQGVKAWNRWREENFDEKIDLSAGDFKELDLREINLCGAFLNKVNFRRANLSRADISFANLKQAIFSESALRETNITRAIVGQTIFEGINLSEIYNLETVHHILPSIIDINTLKYSKGNISPLFLRGCGLSDWEIENSKLYKPNLENEEINKIIYNIYDIRAAQALQISPLFISYSHDDTDFVNLVSKELTIKGIRFWRDIYDMTAGRMETQIDRAIQQNPTVLVVLSKNSLNSDWVQHEVRKARELEKEIGRDVLCPVALDDNWKSAPWPARVMEQIMEYNILDFSGWEDDTKFNEAFTKLLNGLDLFYKRPGK